jgi:hypothetical protein
MVKVYVSEEIDVSLEDFDTYDLKDELEARGELLDDTSREIIEAVYEKRRLGKPYDSLLNDLIYNVLGKIV